MTAQGRPFAAEANAGRAGASEALIVGVEISAGHDGTAEMVVQVQYENGVIAPVVLDQETGLELMQACGAASLSGLIGRSWREIFRTTSLGNA